MPSYVISWSNPLDRLFDVTISFVAPCDAPRLLLPAWRPGRYLIQNYAANVREWDSRMWKDGKSSWRVRANEGEAVTISYRYYAGVLDAGSSFLDEGEAYFNGSNLFMMVEGLRDEEHQLTIAAPESWTVETQLAERGRRLDDGAWSCSARDYDHLIDSPVIAAETVTRHTFAEAGATMHLVFRDDEGVDTESYVEPLRRIVRAQAELFGGLPLTEYRFLYHLRDRWHGVEHESSSSIVINRKELDGDRGRSHFLSLSSHEFFHLWNVKRIVPAAFTPYDYSREIPTRLLWVMEGLTSYYGDRMLLRAGIWSERDYLDHLEEEIATLESATARLHVSLAQASFDGWLTDPGQQHDRGNATISFYNKGEIVAALLDLTIQHASAGTRSLDDVMRLLWTEYGMTGRGLEEDGFEQAVARIADVGDFFARYVEGTDPLPYAEVFGRSGISCTIRPSAAIGLGATFGAQPVFQVVRRGGAAFAAGVLPGDELLAIDGVRVTSESDAEKVLHALQADDTVEMIVVRAGKLLSLQLLVQADPRPDVTLTRV